MRQTLPVIDLFAGPGGLGEGFAAFVAPGRKRATFRIALSIEKEYFAHQTLVLRSFYRQFVQREVPEAYFDYLRQKISRDELFAACPQDARKAASEARRAEPGHRMTGPSTASSRTGPYLCSSVLLDISHSSSNLW